MTFLRNINMPSKANIPFREYLMLQCLPLRRWSLLVAFFLYAIFAVLDVLRFPVDVYQITLSIRFIFVLLPLAILNYIFWFRPPKSIVDNTCLILLVYLGAGLNHSLIHYYAETYQLAFSQLGLVLIFMFGSLLVALTFRPALIASVIILITYGTANFYLGHSSAELFLGLLILALVAGLCLLINRVCEMILSENYELIQTLYADSITDGLTSLYNKRFFEIQLEQVCLSGRRESNDVSLLLLDFDHFKLINDRKGHIAGDKILQAIGPILKSVCRRPNDFACRIGGDEFAIIYYGICQKRLHEVCKELLAAVTKIQFATDKTSNATVSASIGFATHPHTDDVDGAGLTARADRALYQAKANGRNTYVQSD